MPNELKFNVKYRVPARIIYETLTNPMEITKLTQCPAKFENSVNGEFNFYDGFITGVNMELEQNKKTVQKWKFNNWKDYGICTMTFKEKPGNECMIVVNFKEIPERDNFNQTVDLEVIEKGFRMQIFQKIQNFLGYPMNNDEDSDSD